jgi:hypothetical protein
MADTRGDNDNVKDINNIDRNDSTDNDKETDSFSLTKEELLAMDLAEGLNDRANLGFYIFVSRKYPEGFLRRIYSQVKEVPSNKIKKSKGALFNYLIQKYDKNNHCG